MPEQRGFHDDERAQRGEQHEHDVAAPEVEQARLFPHDARRGRDEAERSRGGADREKAVAQLGSH